MFSHSYRRYIYSFLSRTTLGVEALQKTKQEMQQLSKSKRRNVIVNFLIRKRPIDTLAINVDDKVAKELHWSFNYIKHFCTLCLCAPVLYYLLTGKAQPTYHCCVGTGLVSCEKYNDVLEHKLPRWLQACGQLMLFVLFYDLSVYIRYPFFARVLAPAYRRLHLINTVTKESALLRNFNLLRSTKNATNIKRTTSNPSNKCTNIETNNSNVSQIHNNKSISVSNASTSSYLAPNRTSPTTKTKFGQPISKVRKTVVKSSEHPFGVVSKHR